MNYPARVTISYTDLSQNTYVVNEHDDVLEVYRLLDEIHKKQVALEQWGKKDTHL